jgi:hypothetical protein
LHCMCARQTIRTACVPGKYAVDDDYNCVYCPVAKYSEAYAASREAVCQYCAPGQYSDVSNMAHGSDRCVECLPNSFSNPGTEPGHGDRVQAQCSCNDGYAVHPGYPWHPVEDIRLQPEQLCQPCAAGTYQPEAVQWTEIGYLVNEWTVPSCLQCPAQMTSASRSTVCVCSAGSYGAPGSALCEPCCQNEFIAVGALTSPDCLCRAGYVREGFQCVACRIGSFRTLAQQEQTCVPCASGSSTLRNASNSSDMCVECAACFFVAESGECLQ